MSGGTAHCSACGWHSSRCEILPGRSRCCASCSHEVQDDVVDAVIYCGAQHPADGSDCILPDQHDGPHRNELSDWGRLADTILRREREAVARRQAEAERVARFAVRPTEVIRLAGVPA